MQLINKGTSPAKNLRYYFHFKSSTISLDELIQHKNEIMSSEESIHGGILPVGTAEAIEITFEHDFEKSNEVWLAFWFRYDYLNVKNYEEIIIIQDTKSQIKELYFYDKEQIDDSKKRGGHSPGM